MKYISKEIYRYCGTNEMEVFETKSRNRKAQEAVALMAYCLKTMLFDVETIARMLNVHQATVYAAIRRTEGFKEIRDIQTITILAKLSKITGYDF